MTFGDLVPGSEESVFTSVHGFSFGPTDGDDGSWFGSFDVTDAERQPYGIVHGGMYSALAETVASVATALNKGLLGAPAFALGWVKAAPLWASEHRTRAAAVNFIV